MLVEGEGEVARSRITWKHGASEMQPANVQTVRVSCKCTSRVTWLRTWMMSSVTNPCHSHINSQGHSSLKRSDSIAMSKTIAMWIEPNSDCHSRTPALSYAASSRWAFTCLQVSSTHSSFPPSAPGTNISPHHSKHYPVPRAYSKNDQKWPDIQFAPSRKILPRHFMWKKV